MIRALLLLWLAGIALRLTILAVPPVHLRLPDQSRPAIARSSITAVSPSGSSRYRLKRPVSGTSLIVTQADALAMNLRFPQA